MTRTGSTLALALALSLAALAAQGCCGRDDDDPTGGEVSLINSTPHFVHFFLPDEVFLYVQPGTTRTVNLDKDNSGRFLLAMAPGQGVKGTSEAFGTLCGCGSCGTVTAEWTYGQVVTNIQGGSACGGSSCPHVLAHDGERFVLQGEGLTGAINQGAQRADALVLPALRPMKGEYLVRLSTALPERDYIDSASLELIDHPPGSRIALDTEGSAHALAGIVRPLSAMDSAGADRLKEIAKRDGKAWVARKQGNAPSQRGTLELTFQDGGSPGRPMVLVVTGRNTPFIEHTYHRFMARFGPGWPRLMRLMSRLPWYRGSMKAFAHGAGLGLTVEVKEEGGWREAGWLPPVGITGDRAVAVPLKIRDKKAKLQLRLVALPGAWAIDEVFGAMEERAAVGGEALLKSRLLGVKRADHVHAGRSSAVSPARLSRANGRRARLVQGGHLTLSFGAPPPRPIHERTAVLRLTGYYEELSRSPKPCLEVARLTRCLAGEHCFARYTLEQLSRQRGRLPKKTGSSNMGVAGAGAKVH